MARSKPSTRAAPARRGRKPEAKPVAPMSRESLIAAMGEVLDGVDERIRPMRGELPWHYGSTALGAGVQVSELMGQMIELLRDSDEEAQEVFRNALMSPFGTAPSLARPARFVEWIGYVPVLVEWGGFLTRGADIRAIDPAEKWITPSGYRSLFVRMVGGDTRPRGWAREVLSEIARSDEFNLFPLSDWGRENTAERLAAEGWLRDALRAGPVDPIPLPSKLHAVQRSLL